MAYSAAAFVEAFPEFATTNTAKPLYVGRKLAEAATYVDPCVWPAERVEDAIYIKAAHLLSMSPHGENARLHKFSDKTLYSVLWDQAIAALPVRGMVV
jgi:hypothetical protein